MEHTPVPKRILFVINSLAGGGAERVMATLLRHSGDRRDRYAMSLALLDEEASAYAPPEWLPVHRLDSGGGLVRSARRLRALVGETRPDLVLSFLTRSNVAACLATAGRDVPFAISERVNTSAHLPRNISGRVSRTLVRRAYPRARRVIAVSEGVAEDLSANFGVARARVRVLANPVDGDLIRARAQEPDSLPVDGPYVVAMGRLVPNKNFALLIDAFADAAVPGKLVILGEGPERDALERRIAARNLGGRVLLPGFLDNPFPLIAGADCYVLPSNAEGFPNGLVEAMALGLPVISTDCPSGPSEILAERPRGGLTGLDCAAHGLLVPCDDHAALAEGLRRYQDPDFRQRYAAAARARADAFSVAASVGRYWEVIEEALADAPLAAPRTNGPAQWLRASR
ncbi:glycosyltransferase [Sphingosinicella sp. LHD-64]|uniref:glycosyltransferase n=1 Tax=Sphingosinicella sp. LHD-64 TaxID=3072139 RepID=UPI00280EBDB4|nr:glycosyltransferase [Sphingosinicella sp. LHD-64]MDQ8755447.1 glycosyltransferase [Sphingosinicella sp. LHD-64]